MTTELLERAEPLSELISAHEEAADARGSVVLVSGEPGIGKTSLVSKFVADLGTYGRVLWGTCDDITVPRPLGPFRDFAQEVGGGLSKVLSGRTPPRDTHALVLEELADPPHPVVLVLEDVHWADGATLDAITHVGRRLDGLKTLMVLTFRDREVPPEHPLHATLASVREAVSHHLELAPLSREAVQSLVGTYTGTAYETTRGNPFLVTELVAWKGGGGAPPSVASAVGARIARLGLSSRCLAEIVSVVPNRVPTQVLDVVMPAWEEAAAESERAGLLQVEPHHVHFPHELSRIALRDSLTASRRRLLHADVLTGLIDTDSDPADILYHADRAGDTDAVVDHVLRAAHRAMAAESYPEGYAHYQRATAFASRWPLEAQAVMFEELAVVAHLVGEVDEAVPAIEEALRINRELGNTTALARSTRMLGRLLWNRGDITGAAAKGREAVEILRDEGPSVELAAACGYLSTAGVLSSNHDEGLEWGYKALALSEELGDRRTRVQALVNIGAANLYIDKAQASELIDAHAEANELGDRFEAQRALLCLSYGHLLWVMPEPGLEWTERFLEYVRKYDMVGQEPIALSMRARYHLREGRWGQALELLEEHWSDFSEFVSSTVDVTLASLAVRRGMADAAERLSDVGARADLLGDLMRQGQVLEAEVDWALTTTGTMPLERAAKVKNIIETIPGRVGAEGAVAAAWAAAAGAPVEFDEPMPAPYEAMVRSDWRGAADAFGKAGWSYDCALMLSLLDHEEALAEALEIVRDIGADPLARRVRNRMRELEMSVPQGPRRSTRANPEGLTNRQIEVLAHVADGLTNPEIAHRLYVSARTVDRHVHDILRKLAVGTRKEAGKRAVDLGIVDRS